MVSALQDLATKYRPNITPILRKILILQEKKDPFKKHALKLLMEAEEMIPGAGIHYSIIKGNRYTYPADYKFERVVRPLRYALNELGGAYTGFHSARYSVEASGGHLEGCIKTLLGWPRNRKPLGALTKTRKIQKILGKELAEDISRFTDLAVNPAKHEYVSKDGLKPVLQFADALFAHFLARHFGAIILEKANALDYIEALRPVIGRKIQCFPGAPFPVAYDDKY